MDRYRKRTFKAGEPKSLSTAYNVRCFKVSNVLYFALTNVIDARQTLQTERSAVRSFGSSAWQITTKSSI